jgi:hypothetical protein
VVVITTGTSNVIIGAYSRASTAGATYANALGYDINGAAGYTTVGASTSDIRATWCSNMGNSL